MLHLPVTLSIWADVRGKQSKLAFIPFAILLKYLIGWDRTTLNDVICHFVVGGGCTVLTSLIGAGCFSLFTVRPDHCVWRPGLVACIYLNNALSQKLRSELARILSFHSRTYQNAVSLKCRV